MTDEDTDETDDPEESEETELHGTYVNPSTQEMYSISDVDDDTVTASKMERIELDREDLEADVDDGTLISPQDLHEKIERSAGGFQKILALVQVKTLMDEAEDDEELSELIDDVGSDDSAGMGHYQ